MTSKRHRGQEYEERATKFLQREGYEIVARNFRVGRHEIDIICTKDEILVFAEVKGGRTAIFGDPVYKVDQRKQCSIIEVAEGYLQQSHIAYSGYRFDVIIVEQRDGKLEIRQIESAFTL